MQEISYVVLAFGVLGIALGLYGWLFPTVRERIAGFLHASDDDLADDETEAGDVESRRALALARLEARRNTLEQQRAARPRTPSIAPPPPLPVTPEPADELEDDLALPVGETDDDVIGNPVRVVKLEAPPVVEDAPPVATMPETAAVAAEPASVLEEPRAPAADGDDMLAFFAEAAEESSTSPVLRQAIEVVSAQELLEEARSLRALLSGSNDT